MTKIAAAILAGGRGERMGGANKALLELDGRLMIDRVLEAVSRCDPVLLSAGDWAFPANLGIPARHIVPDLKSGYGGPLAGVAAIVDHLMRETSPDLLLTLAVDTPHFPSDFAKRAEALMREADIVVGAFGGQDYPTNAVWRFSVLESLPERVRQGTAPHSLKSLIAEHRSLRIDYAAVAAINPFANANTPEELAALGVRRPL